MLLTQPLDDILRARSHVRVLRALDELPSGLPVSGREIARRSGVSHPTVSRVLGVLVDHGLVSVRRLPRTDGFELNRGHVAVVQIAALLAWERDLLDELVGFLRTQIRHHAPAVNRALLFGSVARSEMSPASDIDVAVLCPPSAAAEVSTGIERVGEPLRKRFGNRLSVVIGTGRLEDLGRRGRSGHELWRRVAREGKPIIGPAPAHAGAEAGAET